MGMEKDKRDMTERILDLTFEIIYLLTGENHKIVKTTSGEPLTPSIDPHRTSPITKPPPHCLTGEINNAKKILKVIKKIIKLMTGEVPIRCQDVTVYFSMEEWEYLEGHKDLYKDVMMEDESDGYRKRNPPPRPQDSTKEELTIPHNDQVEEQINIKVEIKEEDLETYVGGDQPSMEVAGMMKLEEDEISLPISTTDGCDVRNTSERHLILSADCKSEDDVITQDSPAVNPDMQNIHHRPSCAEISMDPSDQGESSDQSHAMTGNIHQVSHKAADPSNPEESMSTHKGDHSGWVPFTVCETSSTENKRLLQHQRTHTGDRPYSCSECGKSFTQKRFLVKHQKTHTGDRPYTCSECGKSFTERHILVRHQKTHTGIRPYSCPECGRCFPEKDNLVKHQKTHTGECPYSCSECGKCFSVKYNLVIHLRTHTDERPFSCLECGKSFTYKRTLIQHLNLHTGERPYSCSECGKCFSDKYKLLSHQKRQATECLHCLPTEGNV